MNKHVHMGVEPEDWGDLQSSLKHSMASVLSVAINWNGKPQGIVVAWRKKNPSFSEDDMLLLGRLAGISSLALNTANTI